MPLLPALFLLALHAPVKHKVTLAATLKVSSKVPALKSIAPYKNALVSGDYTVTKIVSGQDPSVKVGKVIRIFRWGIFNRSLTGLKTKKGAQATLTIISLNDSPEMQREYQVEDLPVTNSTVYFVEVK